MVMAFQNFEKIQMLQETKAKHREWLKDYEGLFFSIGKKKQDCVRWKEEKEKYVYFDNLWNNWAEEGFFKKEDGQFSKRFFYADDINKIQRHPSRLTIEFDDEESQKRLENTQKIKEKLKKLGFGFIVSTHKGKCDYVWVEFSRAITDEEAKRFLFWIAPKNSKIDTNFANSNYRLPVLFGVHWKYGVIEEPIEFNKGEQIDIDSLKLKKVRFKESFEMRENQVYATIHKEEKEENKKTKEELKLLLGQTYENIIEILKYYSDLKERDYIILSLWIIGTHFYKQFLTFPYLFLNAMKGSGKSRTLRLICNLAWNGQVLGSITEAGLFRIAGKGTIGLDEFEGVAKKENHGLREILNSGYKKGMKIVRMKKQKTAFGEEQVAEYFEPYTPIVMANIWGMEEVLGDRCITSILEKSSDPKYTLKVEDFENDILIKNTQQNLKVLSENTNLVYLCSYFSEKNIYKEWNNWVDYIYNYTYTETTHTTHTTLTTLELERFFNQIIETGLNGRDLELFLPLILIGKIINDDLSTTILKIAKEKSKEKRQEEMMESKDILLIEFVSKQEKGFYSIKSLTMAFREYIDYDINDEFSNWCNPKWLGRALKRLELIIDKRRMGSGIEITLNLKKASEKMLLFK